MQQTLVDTGFLVSVFQPREKHHAASHAWLATSNSTLMTVEAVVSETCFFLQATQRAEFLKSVVAGALNVAPLDATHHARIVALHVKYRDLDPDYADLALVALAESINVARILTLDRKDFETYRLRGRKRFQLLPWTSRQSQSRRPHDT